MTDQPANNGDAARRAGLLGLLRRNAWALLLAGGMTILVQMAVFAAASAALSTPYLEAATLMGSLLWVVLAGPMFAAGARSPLDALLRTGAVIDAGIVVLVVLAAGGGALRPVGAAKIYLLWCAVAGAQWAAVHQAGTVRTRHIVAAATAAAVLIVAASPFWANHMIQAAPGQWQGRLALALTASNPVYATVGCLADAGFVWHEQPILYHLTSLGRDAVPMRTCPWYVTAAGYAAVALGLVLRAHLAGRRRAEEILSHR